MSGGYRPLAGVVMAAGEGTRMRSLTPKVLHPLCGRPMVLHVIHALSMLSSRRTLAPILTGLALVWKRKQSFRA